MPKILHSLLPKSLHFWLPFTYATDCLTDYASRREIPISNAVVELKNMGAFPTIYRAARKSVLEPSGNVVSRLIEQGKGV